MLKFQTELTLPNAISRENKHVYLDTGSRRIKILTKKARVSGYVRERNIKNGETCTLDFVPRLKEWEYFADYVEPAIDAVVRYCNHQKKPNIKLPQKPLLFPVFSRMRLNPPSPWDVRLFLELESDSGRLIWTTMLVAMEMKILRFALLLGAQLLSSLKSRRPRLPKSHYVSLRDQEMPVWTLELFHIASRPRQLYCWVCKQDGIEVKVDYSEGCCSKCRRSLIEIYNLKTRLDWLRGV